MKRMIYTHFNGNDIVNEVVYFMSAYYRPGDGVKAIVICDDNVVHEISIDKLSLPTDEYNKIFAE